MAMVRIGNVWDDTTDVLAGRAGLLLPLAGLTLALPAIVQSALAIFGGAKALTAVVALIVAVIALWGRLAITGIALDPATTAAQARSEAGRRLLPYIGVLIVLGAAGLVLVAPILYALNAAGFDWSAAAAGQKQKLPPLGPGIALYGIGLLVLAIWATARIKLLLAPVVMAEGRRIGAIGRSVQLTRGLTWKLIGVVLLYYVVLGVCVFAATSVTGLMFRLLLGADSANLARFLAGVVGVLVATVFDVIAQVFAARLHAAARRRAEDVATPA